MESFSEIKLIEPLQKALRATGYVKPTPIQKQAIPILLDGHDLLGIAQTGTGKTAAFCLPILHFLHENRKRPAPGFPRALILTPTRELAIQIHQNLETYSKYLRLHHAVIFGGVGQSAQVKDLRRGVDILVATPGRLLDLGQQGHLNLNRIEFFVLDEADRMLDMGFMPDIQRILPMLPDKRHNLFFSATMPKEIQSLANKILVDPQKVEVTPQATTVEKISQSAMFVEKKDKMPLLVHLIKEHEIPRLLVFVEMKHVANRVADYLEKNDISAAAIHGNKSQGARQRAIANFSEGRVQVLVATDIASRGIDIEGITHVINYELSNVAESYVHRIGRTARAGAEGVAFSFVTGEEKAYLANVERTTRQKIPIVKDQPFHSEAAESAPVLSVGKAKALIEGERKKGRRPPRRHSDSPKSKRKSDEKRSHGSRKDSSKSEKSSANKRSESDGRRKRPPKKQSR